MKIKAMQFLSNALHSDSLSIMETQGSGSGKKLLYHNVLVPHWEGSQHTYLSLVSSP